MLEFLPASILDHFRGLIAYALWNICLALQRVIQSLAGTFRHSPSSKHAGKTVLVTIGRQCGTYHAVRALKQMGCKVIVTDYQEMSASAVSSSCDAFYMLPPLDSKNLNRWVDRLEEIIIEEHIDLVLPMSTINEALFMSVAKNWLQDKYPNTIFACVGLDLIAQLDKKDRFGKLCQEIGVPVPEQGVVTSSDDLKKNVPFGKMDVLIKRIESSVNREGEMKVVPKEKGFVPKGVSPTQTDPWLWQRFIHGVEYSAWFVCFEGHITFQCAYVDDGDCLSWEGLPVPREIEQAISKLAFKHNLTGQYTFDYFKEISTGNHYLIQCKPWTSSVLVAVSGTPGWAASFFGDDVRDATIYQKIGFWFHRNCWPFVKERSEGYFHWLDPLPLLVAEVAWPFELLRIKGLVKGGMLNRMSPLARTPRKLPTVCQELGLNYQELDVNIGKVIVPGPVRGRDYEMFEAIQQDIRGSFIRSQVWTFRGVAAPQILCTDTCVADALKKFIARKEVHIRRLDKNFLRENPKLLFQCLVDKGESFHAIFLPQELLKEMPAGLLAAGGRAVATETMPKAQAGCVNSTVAALADILPMRCGGVESPRCWPSR